MAEVRRANGVSVEAGLLLNFGIRTAQIRARPHTISAIPKTFHFDARHQFQIDVASVSV